MYMPIETRRGVKDITVDHPTSLRELLKPGMGAVHWAAGRSTAVGQHGFVDVVKPGEGRKQ